MADDWFKPGTIPTPQPEPSGPPRRKGPSLVRLILFALIAFWIFAKFSAPAPDAPRDGAEENPAPRAVPERDTTGMPPLVPPPGVERPQSREATAETRSRPMPEARPSSRQQEDSDWSIEEVEVDRPAPVEGSGVTFDPSSSVNEPSDGGKKTTKGDWSLEEVEAQ